MVYVTHIHTHTTLLALAIHHYTEYNHAWCPTTGAYAVKTHLHRHMTDITKTVTPRFTSFLLKHRALLITTTPRMALKTGLSHLLTAAAHLKTFVSLYV